MNEKLDSRLVEQFPKLFRDRYASMRETCMCWGFEHGDGWYNIIHALCANIQHHIDWSRKQRANALRYNRAVKQSSENYLTPLVKYFAGRRAPNDWDFKNAEEVFKDVKKQTRTVPQACSQVVVSQVKEKFGTLRFYYSGGDDTVDGMVRMAESMSALTCEECGVPGVSRHGGWIRTLCDEHAKADGRYLPAEEDKATV